MVYRFILAIFASIAISLWPLTTMAAPQNKGLTISPAQQNVSASAGKVSAGAVRVANYSGKQLVVTLFVKQFSTTNYVYDYTFSDPQDDWVKLEKQRIVLQPTESVNIKYTVAPPVGASPGGHYFALFASADMSDSGVKQTAQVVSLLYVKVAGAWMQSGTIENGSAPFWVTGNEIPYTFNAKNTGNIDYTTYFYGQLESLFGKLPATGTNHVLMPGTVRTVGGTIPAPLLPGIYRLTYGYKTNTDSTTTTKSSYIIYVPLWSIALLVLLLVIGQGVWRRTRKKRVKTA